MTSDSRLLCVFLVVAALFVDGSAAASAPASPSAWRDRESWAWPVAGPKVVVEPYRAPAHAYGAGHRGVDVEAPVGSAVIAPAAGTVAFTGTVVDRPLMTIEHADGFVTTFEPVTSALRPGDAVVAGDLVGEVATGGHTAPGALHIGVRLHGNYINPLLLFEPVPRAVLLPCCELRQTAGHALGCASR